MLFSIAAFLIALAKADWAWVGGSEVASLGSSFQGLFVESPANLPGGLSAMAYAVNGSYVYVFGGLLRGPTSNYLLRFNTNNLMWAALSMPASRTAEFGVKGVFSASVRPVAKSGSVVFFDTTFNSLFVFSGDSVNGRDNSMFQFSFDSMMWRWIHGTNSSNDFGLFGVLGVESPFNLPAGRSFSAYFYDRATRKGYIYGGWSSLRSRADHWVYSVENNTWTWIHGTQETDALGIYGQMGVGTNLTRPGSRYSAAFTFDETRRIFYLYGGMGYSEVDVFSGHPTDLWQYEPDRNMWTFLKGNRDSEIRSNYGTKGVTQEGTFPRSRSEGQMVIDHFSQKLYIFSGSYFLQSWNYFNDLWVLDLNTLLWTWIAGSNLSNAPARYGTMGVASPLNNPAARASGMLVFAAETRQLLLYGGKRSEYYNDLWAYSLLNSSQSEASSIVSTATTTERPSRRTATGTMTSSISAELAGVIIATSVVSVGILALVIAYIRYMKLKQKQLIPQKSASGNSSNSGPTQISVVTNRSTYGDVTLVSTSLGLSLPAHLQVKEVDFRSGELIASGGGGDVYRGEAVSDELIERCRLIVVKRPKITRGKLLKLFEQEISVMFLLSKSPFVAKIVGFMLDPTPVMLLKMYPDGSLISFASKSPPSRKWKLRFFRGIARGLADIHKAQIAHCDLKPQNVLIDRDSNNRPFCVITDFGISQVLSEKLIVVKYSELVRVRGLSVKYAAPEVFVRFNSKIDSCRPAMLKASDVYALSMCFFFILCRKEAWR